MAKQTDQLTKELKQLDTKEIDPCLLYIREFRGRSVNEDQACPTLHNLSQFQPMCQA